MQNCEYPILAFKSTRAKETFPDSVDSHGQSENLNDKPLPALNLIDLELLHNYCTATCFTLHSDPVQRRLWQINVVQTAFSFEFVMRGVLALSALHLAHLHLEKKDFHISLAREHNQTSLHEPMTILPNITPENCNGLYIFSILTAFYAIASPRMPEDFLIVEETGIAPWLMMVRGTTTISDSSKQTLDSGPFGPMMHRGGQRVQLREVQTNRDSIGEQRLMELQQHITGAAIDTKELSTYNRAIDELQKSYAALSHVPGDFSITDVLIVSMSQLSCPLGMSPNGPSCPVLLPSREHSGSKC